MAQRRVKRWPWEGLAWVAAAYLAAGVSAAAAVAALSDRPVLWQFAAAELAATVAVFLFSRMADNTSVYDPYWSVAPLAQALWLGTRNGLTLQAGLVLVLVAAWSVRLTWNWARGWNGLAHEDWRYVDFRRSTGGLYWVVSFFGLHLFPTVMTSVGGLALFPVFESGGNLGGLDALATGVMVLGIALETVADAQLRAFRAEPVNEGRICEVGLWKWSRHPNYLGEILFWLGLALFSAAAGGTWPTLIGPWAMLAMFQFASIPLAEQRSKKRRPEWPEYQRRTARLVLRRPR